MLVDRRRWLQGSLALLASGSFGCGLAPPRGTTPPGEHLPVDPEAAMVLSNPGELVLVDRTFTEPAVFLVVSACEARVHLEDVVVAGDLVVAARGGDCGALVVLDGVRADNVVLMARSKSHVELRLEGTVEVSGSVTPIIGEHASKAMTRSPTAQLTEHDDPTTTLSKYQVRAYKKHAIALVEGIFGG